MLRRVTDTISKPCVWDHDTGPVSLETWPAAWIPGARKGCNTTGFIDPHYVEGLRY